MILASQIKFYKSSGSGSSGGGISATEVSDGVLNNLFDDVAGDDTVSGLTTYKKIFVKNTNGSDTYLSPKVWIEQFTDSEDDEIYISECTNLTGSNATGDGQSYVQPDSYDHADALTLGNIAANGYVAIWIKRVVDSGASEYNTNSSKLKIRGSINAI